MSQYSDLYPLTAGGAVSAVLDSQSNTITYTVTASTGQVATLTLPQGQTPGVTELNSVRSQIRAQGGVPGLSIEGFGEGLRTTRFNTISQATTAQATATATNTPPPAAPNPPAPVTRVDNPNSVPPSQGEQTAATSNVLREPSTISGPTGTPFDDDGNLNVGWGLDENGSPVWVGPGYIDATGQTAPSYNAPPTTTAYQGTPFDDDGNLNVGWTLDENGNPVFVGGDFVEPSTAQLSEQNRNTARGLAAKTNAQTQATAQDQANFTKQEDWRVRLSLAPGSNYLYNKKPDPGILKPLADTNGVIFPYTPSIQISYAANYEPTDLIHSNYKVYQYRNSAVDNIQISCDFTAQDTYEANYLLAVIHFFRSVTKMFYGQDNGPKPGTPPPLCFLTGLGAFQFNEHPLAIVSFNYTLPTDVDYIRAGQTTSLAGVNLQSNIRPDNSYSASSTRLTGNVGVGGNPANPSWQNSPSAQPTVTYVPTKMQIQIGAVPMMSRNDISNNFSLNDYASGKLLRGLQNVRGGFW